MCAVLFPWNAYLHDLACATHRRRHHYSHLPNLETSREISQSTCTMFAHRPAPTKRSKLKGHCSYCSDEIQTVTDTMLWAVPQRCKAVGSATPRSPPTSHGGRQSLSIQHLKIHGSSPGRQQRRNIAACAAEAPDLPDIGDVSADGQCTPLATVDLCM
jgi:hypothetical protein